jgi:hypothetical protein
VVLEHGAHGVAQQRGVVAGQRRHDQHRGLVLSLVSVAGSSEKRLKRRSSQKGLVDFDALMDRDLDAIGIDRANPEFRLFIIFAQAMQEVEGCRNPLGKRVR